MNPTHSKYKAVIFDFDDTLVESRALKWAQHKHVAKKFYDIDLTDEDIRPHWGKPFNTLIGELYRNSDTLENMNKAIYSVRDDFLKKVYDQSVETVQALLRENVAVGVLSAANRDHLDDELSRLGFPTKKFTVIQGADETLVHKPDPKVFLPIFESLSGKGIEKEAILYVGDSLDDFRAASDAGIDFLAVTTGLYSHDDFAQAGAKKILSNIREVADQIFKTTTE